jgi:excisionase family DNA binding protein
MSVNPEQYMTTAEVADLCRTSPDTVRYWRHVGRGPTSFKVGRRVLYPTSGVQTWLAALQNETASN